MNKLYKILGGITATAAFVLSGCVSKFTGGFLSSYKKKEPISIVKTYEENLAHVWENGKLDADEIRGIAKDYLDIKKRLAEDKDLDKKEKKDLQTILNKDKKILDQYVSKTNIKVAYVMKISTPAEKIYRGTDHELKAVEKKSIDDVAKDFGIDRVKLLAKLISEYTPLSGSYDDLNENTYIIEITKDSIGKIRGHLKNGLEGRVKISAEKIKELTDGKIDNGEIKGFAIQLYEPEGLSWTSYDPTKTTPTQTAKTTNTNNKNKNKTNTKPGVKPAK